MYIQNGVRKMHSLSWCWANLSRPVLLFSLHHYAQCVLCLIIGKKLPRVPMLIIIVCHVLLVFIKGLSV